MGAFDSMSPNEIAQSISKKLSEISRESNIAYNYVAMNFFIERMAYRILATSLRDQLVFKGGFVGLRVYNSKRYTIDLDAVLNGSKNKEHINQLKKIIQSESDDGVWFVFEKEENLLLQSYKGGLKQIYRTGLGKQPKDISRSVKVHLDIGFDDLIYPAPVLEKTSTLLGEGELSWKVYPVETIISEKIHAFISREGGSSRAKDLYDLSLYLPQANKNKLKKSLMKCFQHRETNLPESIYETMKSYSYGLVEKSWSKVSSVVSEKVEFENCLSTFLNELKKLDL